MECGRPLPFPARGCSHVALGLCILITVRDLTGELARATDAPNIAAASVGTCAHHYFICISVLRNALAAGNLMREAVPPISYFTRASLRRSPQ